MTFRHSFLVLLVLPALGTACSSASATQTHGPVVDASDDTVTDNPPDASPDGGTHDAAREAGRKEAGHDAKSDRSTADAPSMDAPKGDAASCKGTVALAGGTASVAFVATSVDGAAWGVTSLPTTSTQTNPALAPFTGFVAVFTASTTDMLVFSAYASSSWSLAANAEGSTCTAAPTAFGVPALAAIGKTLHSVYLGTNNDFYHGTYTKTGWDCEDDPLTFGGSPSFGPSAPAAASVGSSLVAAFDGSDTQVYTQSWTSGTWAAAEPISGTTVGTTPPSLMALTGGSSDLLLVYANAADDKLYWTARSSGTWSLPALTNMNAYSLQPVSIAPLAAGGAVLTFLGTDDNPYAMTFDPTASTPWTSPVAILTGGQPLPSAPTVAAGVCGTDAVAAIVQPAGIELVTLSSGTWSSPTLVGGTASMGFVTIATR